MKLKTQIEYRLENDKDFRERRNKNAGIAKILMARYPGLMYAVQDGRLSNDAIVAALQDYASMDRAWRKALEERPDLRGTDYDDKDRLEAETMEELDYKINKVLEPVEAAEPEKQKTLL